MGAGGRGALTRQSTVGEETLSRHGQARSASRHAMRRSEVQAVARHSRRSGGAATSQGEGERAGKRAGERLPAQLSRRERMTAHFSLARARDERTSCQRPNPSTYSLRIACEIAPSATPTTASIEWPRAAQCAQPHAKKAPPTNSSARRRLRTPFCLARGAGSCGGARSTLGRPCAASAGAGARPPAALACLSLSGRSAGAACRVAGAECHPRPGRRAGWLSWRPGTWRGFDGSISTPFGVSPAVSTPTASSRFDGQSGH